MASSLYIHVPFCVVKCGYCDFNSYEVDDRTALDHFLDGLERELSLAEVPDAPLSAFIGGGTPTYLDEERFARMFEVLARHVDLHAIPEVTIEGNPESITEAKGAIARAAGVNRVSIGAQSFDASFLAFLDRAHSAEQTREAVAAMRAAGFANLSLDLMFGLPGQELLQWEADLQAALALRPDHLSCYNLAFEPGTRLTRDRKLGRVAENDPEVDRAMFLATRQVLGASGFVAYEVSNFAGRGGPSRHNDHYWLQGNYLGVGPGAASHRDGVRTTNLKALSAWGAALARGVPPVGETETLTAEQRVREALWLGIRRTDGIDLVALRDRLGIAVLDHHGAVLDDLAAQGLVELTGARLRLTAEGLLFADTVGERLLVDCRGSGAVRAPQVDPPRETA